MCSNLLKNYGRHFLTNFFKNSNHFTQIKMGSFFVLKESKKRHCSSKYKYETRRTPIIPYS